MAKQTIGIGTTPNDGTGDTLRNAFDKTNDNFDELYTVVVNSAYVAVGNSTSNVVIQNNRITVANSTTTHFSVQSNGNIGIGNSTPTNRLVIQFPAPVESIDNTGITIYNTTGSSSWNISRPFSSISFSTGDASGDGAGTRTIIGSVMENTTGQRSRFGVFLANSATTNTELFFEYLTVQRGGNTGIGNTAPIHKLRVEGTLSALNNTNIGNTTANIALNISAGPEIVISNSISNSTLTAGSLTLNADLPTIVYGNSTVNASINATSISMGSGGRVLIGNATVNTAINSTSIGIISFFDTNVGISNTAPATKLQIGGNYGIVATTIASTNNININCASGNYFIATCNGSAANIYFTNAPSNTAYSLILVLANGGGNTVSWANTPKWPNGLAPILTGGGNTDILVFTTHDAGTTWRGVITQKDSR